MTPFVLFGHFQALPNVRPSFFSVPFLETPWSFVPKKTRKSNTKGIMNPSPLPPFLYESPLTRFLSTSTRESIPSASLPSLTKFRVPFFKPNRIPLNFLEFPFPFEVHFLSAFEPMRQPPN